MSFTYNMNPFPENWKWRRRIDEFAMGSLLSPAIANFYMDDFEERALCEAPLKPKCFYRYLDNIKFTMRIEEEGMLRFCDILKVGMTNWT